ncbi:Tkl protein kinase [Globisporangium polare]
MGCSGSKEAEKAVVVPPQQPYRPNPQDPSQQPIGGTRQPRTGGGGQDATAKGPASGNNDRVAKPASRPRIDNNTVDFQEFKDDEKNVVETMLESNKGLRMAEINFHDLKLSKIIGAGAFGEVIKGTYCGTPVVVKRMLRNKITEDNLRMFGEEIQLMMNLRHPNIVQFIGASWNSYSNICFVTEFLERGDLFAVLRNPENTLTWAKPILRMTIDTSRGMAYLHSMKPPIIHRDLKSMNILVSSTWGTKVSDFGLSREKSVDETMSVTGTPLWLPPEMIRGERYTEKADVYSFGIVLSELDTRKIPYHDIKAKGARNKKVSGSTLMHMVAYENLRPSLSPNCMDSVRELYNRCTADDQTMRPTFEEIVQVLENNVRKETLMRANELRVEEVAQSELDVSPEELGVFHATNYLD